MEALVRSSTQERRFSEGIRAFPQQKKRHIPSTPKFLQYKKNLARNSFRKNYKKYFPVHATPRGAHESYRKNRWPQRIPVKNYKKIYKKKPGGELICKNFGVNGKHKFSQRQSITQKGVHTHPLTAWEREHWFLQHLSHFIAVNFGRQ